MFCSTKPLLLLNKAIHELNTDLFVTCVKQKMSILFAEMCHYTVTEA